MTSDTHPLVGVVSVEIDTIPVEARISHWQTMSDGTFVYHFEFRSQGGQPTPISETGYRSHFVICGARQELADLEQHAKDYSASFLGNRDTDQMELF